jgi:hypothetical protein
MQNDVFWTRISLVLSLSPSLSTCLNLPPYHCHTPKTGAIMTRLRISFHSVSIYCLLYLKLLRRRFDCDPEVHQTGTGFWPSVNSCHHFSLEALLYLCFYFLFLYESFRTYLEIIIREDQFLSIYFQLSRIYTYHGFLIYTLFLLDITYPLWFKYCSMLRSNLNDS